MAQESVLDGSGYEGFQDANTNFIEVYANIAALSIQGVAYSLEEHATSDTLVAADLAGNKIHTNTGASGLVTLTLPAGSDGWKAIFIVTVAQNLKVLADGTETFRHGATQSAAGGYVQSNVVGSSFDATWSGTEWVITELEGGALSFDGTTDVATSQYLVASNAAGPAVLDEAATSTNPTLIPNRANPTTGVGWQSSGVLSLIRAGGETLRLDSQGVSIPNGLGLIIGAITQQSIGFSNGEFQLLGTSQADSQASLGVWNNTATIVPALTLYKSRGAAIGTAMTVQTGDRLANINVFGDEGSNDDIRAATIQFETEGTIAADRVPGVIIFKVGEDKAGPSNNTEALRINSALNVGMGVSAFGTNAKNVLGITADGTAPTSSPAGMIQIFGDDSSGGASNATLGIRTEEAVVSEVLACDSTLNIWVNGTEYHLLMRAV